MSRPSLTRESKIYLAIWRKAAAESGLTITLSSPVEAQSVRMAMYRAMTPYKNDPNLEPSLSEIGAKMSLVWHRGESVLHIRDRVTLTSAERLAEQLGLDDDDLLTDSERRMKAAAERSLEAIRPAGQPTEAGEPNLEIPQAPIPIDPGRSEDWLHQAAGIAPSPPLTKPNPFYNPEDR